MKNRTALRGVSSVVAAICIAAACSGEDQPTPAPVAVENTGSIGIALTVAPGITIDSVSYSVTGSGMSPMTGTLPAGDGTGNTFVALINEVPAGPARLVELTANASNGTTCKGEATVDVFVGQVTEVAMRLDCRGDAGGAILINGKLNQCPRIKSLMAAPANAPVGSTISVAASATDVDDPISVLWTATSGSFQNATAPATHFTCATAGPVKITATVTDQAGCAEAASVDVTCTPGEARCGNGAIDPPEQCDGSNLNGETCTTATMNAKPNGTLACSASCTLDTRGCTANGGAGGSGGTMGAGGSPAAGGSGGGM
jgi:hypothetical protein